MMSRAPIKKKPSHGAYISGLFIEAATWDYEKQILVENGEGVLTSLAPTIWLKPTTNDKESHFLTIAQYTKRVIDAESYLLLAILQILL